MIDIILGVILFVFMTLVMYIFKFNPLNIENIVKGPKYNHKESVQCLMFMFFLFTSTITLAMMIYNPISFGFFLAFILYDNIKSIDLNIKNKIAVFLKNFIEENVLEDTGESNE